MSDTDAEGTKDEDDGERGDDESEEAVDRRPLDPGELDAVERGAVLPELVERQASVAVAAALGATVGFLVRLSLALLAIQLAVELIHAIVQIDGAFSHRVWYGTYTFFSEGIVEVRWLNAHVWRHAGTAGGVLALIALVMISDWIGDLLEGMYGTLATSASRVTLVAAVAQANLVDRLISASSHPLGKRRELLGRAVVLLASTALVALLAWSRPPAMWLEVVQYDGEVAIGPAAARYASLGAAYAAMLYLVIQAVLQAGSIVVVAREVAPRMVSKWAPRAATAGAPVLRLVHWSDLHVTAYDDTLTTERVGVGGNRALAAQIAAVAGGDEPIVITGDTSDAGRSLEWRAFFALIAPVQHRVTLVPGNHDLNIVDPFRRSLVADAPGCGRALRQIRMLAALDRVQGERALIAWSDGQDRILTLREVMEIHTPLLRKFYAAPNPDDAAMIHGWYARCFPMAVRLDGGFHLHVFDSNDAADTIATNAFGRIPRAALARFETLAAHLGDAPQLVAMHHHLGYPPHIRARGAKDRVLGRFIVLQNAREVVAALERRGAVVVLHGHKHIGNEGRVGAAIDVISARSTTLGDTFRGAPEPGGRRVTVEGRPGGGTAAIAVEPWPA